MKITVSGPAFDASGYAEALRSVVFCLDALGWDVRLLPSDWSQLGAGLPDEHLQRLRSLCVEQEPTEGVWIQITEAKFFRPRKGLFNIGFTMLETDAIPESWVQACRRMDQVWVPSTFNYRTFAKSGVGKERLRILPLGTDPSRFCHANAAHGEWRDDERFTFLSNFEWVPRKGYDLLLRTYMRTFTARDPVRLLIRTYDGSDYDPEGKKMKRTWRHWVREAGIKEPPKVDWVTGGLTYEEIPKLYAAGDCYVIPTRGEGWNLPAMEAMASGIPVITTAWSAHMDFINERNGYLLRVDRLVPVPEFGIPNDEIYRGSRWAEIDANDLQAQMRRAFTNPHEVKRKGERARQAIVRHWGVSQMKQRLASLLKERKGSG